ncbi:hypothetical protein MH206_11360 [Bacillus altitudinis]|uniref:hypothetical protein n=1 Tax=Bacillus altitudinis TaxID=293387 RepID=UPI0019339CD3|nr:hypothetical protein [Bacillus altitudinis]MCY7629632.1 hypothetical protein [Bacillus altitudinis]MDX2365913.1 hypothetical protein [Bacillus altitudinis]MED1423065.1 hypothetical protein [Bacillus altitudinis]QRF83494.1 hypothetical protein JNE42_18990 [Bacillus altitudinis]
MGKKYKESCIEILKEKGPLLGSELRKQLVERRGVTEGNARAIINRLKNSGAFLSTDPVKLKHQELIYYLPFHDLRAKLKKIMPEHSVTNNRIYQALVEEDGFLLWNEFVKISAGVVDTSQSKRKSAMKIFNDLKSLGIVEEIVHYDHIPVVVASEKWFPRKEDLSIAIRKRIKKISFNKGLNEDLLKWLESMNLIGWENSYVRDIQDFNVGYNGFYFDAIGYTYLWGLYRTDQKDELFEPARNKTGSPVLIESILHRNTKRHDITGFINRIDNYRGPLKSNQNLKVIPICFVNTMEKDAYNLARERGIIIMKLSDVFGTILAVSLQELQEIDPEKVDPQKLSSILDNISNSGRDGDFGNLKGYVFNFLVASIFNDAGYKTNIGLHYKDSEGRKCECDIVYEDVDEIIACEVKGYDEGKEVKLGENESEPDSVRKFFERTCSIIQKVSGKTVIPVFITSGKFSQEATNYLGKKNNSKRMKPLLKHNFPSNIYYDRKALMEHFGNKRRFKEHKRVLKEYFKSKSK